VSGKGGYRYGPYYDGPDPLEPPYDVRGAVDALGESVLAGADPAAALRDLLRKGLANRRGLDDLLRQVRDRQRDLRRSGRLDGILEQARALLDTAIGQERAELFPDPSDDARMREAELDALPPDTAGAIRELSDYQWRSKTAAQTFERLKDLLRREVLDSQFRGIKDSMSQAGPESMARVMDMMAALTDMIEADARGEHTQQDFDDFMAQYGDFFPESPRNLDELVDSLVRRMAAAQRLLNSLSNEQRAELSGLMRQLMADAGLAQEMARLAEALRERRPDIDWDSQRGERMSGQEPLGLGDATTAVAELADLAQLEQALRQDYPGARLDDIDEDAVRRALGRQAVDDMEALKQLERELQRQGYLHNSEGKIELTPKAVRRLGDTALRKVFAALAEGGHGDHDQHDVGQAGELTGATRPWRFGDEQPIDTAATVRNALLRAGPRQAANHPHSDSDIPPEKVVPAGQVALDVADFEVGETERRASAAVCLLVDLSYSMALRDKWGAAKQTALALYSLIRTRYPQDSLQVVGFSNYAKELKETDLARLTWDYVQGTNLHHALVLAGRFLDRRPEHNPVVLIVTDGEPTAHLRRDGRSWFDWPPSRETIELTMAEVDKMTRRRATLNVFMLGDDERLTSFVDEVARRNGGRVLRAMPDSLGAYVVSDFLRSRRERRS
jgi:uncharacterized protein with von Willebrand factor type A (vWA) domain